MSERTILIPNQTINVPEELEELFDVVRQVLSPDTPVWKNTEYSISNKYPITHGPVIDTDFIDTVSVPSPRWSVPMTDACTHATLETQHSDSHYARISFTEAHVLEPKRALYFNNPEDHDIWQLGVETRSTGGEDTTILSSFALNSIREFAGRLWEWRDHDTLSDETFDVDSERVVETARHAGRILTPLDL